MGPAFKPFEQMTDEDYAGLGLRCGLEVHQQLRTRTKLFCRCPAGCYSEEFDSEILRHMRPTLSELGEYDGTALMEKKTRKNIHYRIKQETVCTYEFDDTPPFPLNEEALEIALELALLLRLHLVGELHISRKQYLDGSIPTGFQRTTILGVDGWIPYKDRRIGIAQLGLEEDSCREVSDEGHERVCLTDRLGTPLVETVTYPDMRTPRECAEVCEIIRRLCRSTGKVRTGYGATREDVNVSIRGGTRIEIKGVPQISRIPRLIYNEARRQWSLLRIREELARRGITAETLDVSFHDVTALAGRLAFEPIRAAAAGGERVRCVVLRGFAGVLAWNTQEHTIFAKEFSDRIRVIACLSKLPNMVHSDAATEALSARDWRELRRRTHAGESDALLLVWGPERDAETACQEIAQRAREATIGVPSDTRQALPDGTNGFERVLPGPDRMYPDTDLPPIRITSELLERVRARLPEYVWDREARYRGLGLTDELIGDLSYSPRAALFDRLVGELRIEPRLAAVVLIQQLKALRRAGLDPQRLSDAELYEVFRAFAEGRLAREGIPLVLGWLAESPREGGECQDCAGPAHAVGQRVAQALREIGLTPVDMNHVHSQVTALLASVDPARFESIDVLHRWAMGRLMKELLGRVPGRELAALVRQELLAHCAAAPEPRLTA
jgi:glutamyl-tRNA(Gln) amidotransferase subunit E